MSSNLEINIRSLIAHCEDIANTNNNDWRLKKYIKSLDTMISELEDDNVTPTDNLSEYLERCLQLKKLTNYIEPPGREEIKTKIKLKDTDSNKAVIREINQIHKSKYQNDLRKELFGTEEGIDGIRKRTQNTSGSNSGVDDMGQAVKYYSNMQERIAEDMLSLTRSLKEQTETANKIIKKDTETVLKSTKLSDKNYLSLNSEAEKLQDHSKRAWKCWMWIMIGLVMMIFIFMVLFMKLMKKKVT